MLLLFVMKLHNVLLPQRHCTLKIDSHSHIVLAKVTLKNNYSNIYLTILTWYNLYYRHAATIPNWYSKINVTFYSVILARNI